MTHSPKIAHVVNLNTFLCGPPPDYRPTPLETRIRKVAAAGFDGISAVLTPDHRRFADKYGLEHTLGMIGASGISPDDYASRIQAQKDNGAVHINVQLDDHDTLPDVATKHWLRMVREAEKIGGVEISLETHRDTCTETPEKTYEIAERFQRATGRPIRFTFDLSHFAVVKSLAPEDFVPRLLDHPELIKLAEIFHYRPFNGQHCQVQVHHRGRITPEGESFLAFVQDLMRLWRSDPKNRSRTMFAVPEFLPFRPGGAGYNVAGFAAPWPSAVALRPELDQAWTKSAHRRKK